MGYCTIRGFRPPRLSEGVETPGYAEARALSTTLHPLGPLVPKEESVSRSLLAKHIAGALLALSLTQSVAVFGKGLACCGSLCNRM
jgi:hypothetical protein